jgi:hypothetical protein
MTGHFDCIMATYKRHLLTKCQEVRKVVVSFPIVIGCQRMVAALEMVACRECRAGAAELLQSMSCLLAFIPCLKTRFELSGQH